MSFACLFTICHVVRGGSTFEGDKELPSPSSSSSSSFSSSNQNSNVDGTMFTILNNDHQAEVANENGCSWGRNAHDYCATCRLVVATSTIEGAGLGVFTLVDLNADDTIGGNDNPGDMVIPISKLPFVTQDRFHDYTWSGDLYGGNQIAFSPGLQSLSNSHTGLLNIRLHEAATNIYDRNVPNTRTGSDGTKASDNVDDPPFMDATPYHGIQSHVNSNRVNSIAAGSELFTVYGDNWFEKRSSRYPTMPKSQDFQKADYLVKAFQTKLVDRIRMKDATGKNRRKKRGHVSRDNGPKTEYSHDARRRVDSSSLRRPSMRDEDQVLAASGSHGDDDDYDYHCDDSWQIDAWTVVGDIIGIWGNTNHDAVDDPQPQQQRLATLERILPRPQDLQQIFQLGLRSLYQLQATRPVSDLLQDPTVRCLDGIVPGKSKLITGQSGALGAMATRHFANGTIITGSPLLPTVLHHWHPKSYVWDSVTKSYLFSHRYVVNGTRSPKTRVSFPSHQLSLLINYCFGHVNSTLLLCPYGVGVGYINHSRKPNLAIRWAPDGHLLHNSQYLQMTPNELLERTTASSLSPTPTGLAIDYVALRDIHEGEELTINYGRPWAKAYRNHLKIREREREQQELLDDDASTLTITNAAKYNMERSILLTEAEQVDKPYPHDMQLRCHPNILLSRLPLTAAAGIWGDADIGDMETDANEEGEGAKSPKGSKTTRESFECHVMERTEITTPFNLGDESTPLQEQQILYVARVWYRGHWVGRNDIPRMYFKWFSKENPILFRFPMQLPDQMMPEAWMDNKPGS